LLGNWLILDATVHEEPPQFDCDGNDEGPEVTEVARNIEQVVKQAQKLRETLSVSQLQPHRSSLTKKSTVENFSSKVGFESTKLNNKVQNKTQSAKFSSVNTPQTSGYRPASAVKRLANKHSVPKRSSLHSYSPRTPLPNTNRQSVPVSVVNGNYAQKAVTKPKFKSSPSLQTTYQKDFSLRTNHNIAKHNTATSSNLKPKNSSVDDQNTMLYSKITDSSNVNTDRDPKKSNSTSLPQDIAILDLEDLLSRVTVYSNVTTDSCTKNSKIPALKAKCHLPYTEKVVGITEKAYRLAGLAEAVDVLGVPSDLVTVLKTYHRFLAGNQEGRKHDKRETAAESFLTKLSSMVSYLK
jgi:hypothetical protein